MAAPAGSLVVRIGSDISGLRRGAGQAQSTMDRLGRGAKAVAGRLALISAAAAAAGAALLTGLVKNGLASVDAQAKLARQVNATIDGLRGLRRAAADAGVEAETMDRAVERLDSRLGEAIRGTGEAADALDRLGLSARALAEMDADARMATLADRVQELGLSTAETADILRDFGIRNFEIVNLLRQGGDAIRAARQEIEDFGLSLSEVDAAKVEAANDAMDRIGSVVEVIQTRLAVGLAPALKAVADRINDASKETNGFREQIDQAIQAGIGGFARFLEAAAAVVRFVESSPETAQFGLVGLLLFGKKGALIGSAIGAAFGIVEHEMRKLGVGIDDTAGKLGGVTESIARLESQAAKLREKGVTPDPNDLIGYGAALAEIEGRLALLREEEAALRAELTPEAAEDFKKYFQTGEEGAYRFSDAIAAVAETLRNLKDEGATLPPPVSSAGDGDGGGGPGMPDEDFQRRLDIIRNRFLTEEELQRQHNEVMADLNRAWREGEFETEEEWRAVKEQAEAEHLERLKQLRERNLTDLERFTNASFSKQVKIASGHLADMTASVANENKKLFRINQIAGIANAVVSAYEGISKTLAAYPYPLSVAMASLQAAAAFAQVNAIKSAKFGGGGGSAPSLAGGTPAPPVTPVQGGTPGGQQELVQDVSVTLVGGNMFSAEQLEQLGEVLADNGGRIGAFRVLRAA